MVYKDTDIVEYNGVKMTYACFVELTNDIVLENIVTGKRRAMKDKRIEMRLMKSKKRRWED